MIDLETESEQLEKGGLKKTEELNGREQVIREQKEDLSQQKEEIDNLFKLAKHKLS